MKLAANIAGVLLGLIFNVVAWNYFLHFISMPEPPAGSPPAMFLGAMIPTGYFAFVKVLEISGGILVVIPRTRSLGLLTLGPVLVNIICFHTFLTRGAGLIGLPLIVATLALFLLWSERAWGVLAPGFCLEMTSRYEANPAGMLSGQTRYFEA